MFELVEIKNTPEKLEPGKLYHSKEHLIAIHICPCGCGHEAVTPLESGFWSLAAGPTLAPSISNRICGAHYFLRDGRIEWC